MKIVYLFALIAGVFANPKYPDICGLENKPKVGSRIVGGNETAPNQFPWLVSVNAGGYCTGSLLYEDWVITAAHCVNVDHTAWIKAGIHHRYDGNEPHLQGGTSEKIYKSPHGDLALIKIQKPLEFNEYVRPACLPTRKDENNKFLGVNVTITGWGRKGPGESESPMLFYADGIPVINCGTAANVICTPADGKSICFGDSGGPLNYEIQDGKFIQIGVNQFVTGANCVGGFNGYARMTDHLNFIQETTGVVIE